jgi:hypothetical protein
MADLAAVEDTLRRKPALLKALKATRRGADVYGYAAGTFMRECEKAGLVQIVPAMANVPGEQEQPYFGAVLTVEGRLFLKRFAHTRARCAAMRGAR